MIWRFSPCCGREFTPINISVLDSITIACKCGEMTYRLGKEPPLKQAPKTEGDRLSDFFGSSAHDSPEPYWPHEE